MDKKQYELLSQIRDRYVKSLDGAVPEFQVKESGPRFSARQFYLEDLNDNLVRPMSEQHIEEYSRGSGSELDDKMKALRSSSAMTFNIVGNKACRIDRAPKGSSIQPGEYQIEYERQLPTLKSGLPANLDAFLASENGQAIACEMKMLEWITGSPTPIKEKYLDTNNYIYNDTAAAFSSIAAALNKLHENQNDFDNYDFSQMFKHSLALYNYCRASEGIPSMTLVNCVWEPPQNYELSDDARNWINNSTQKEHAGFNRFLETMQPIVHLFEDELGIPFSIEYVPASGLIQNIAYPVEEKELLGRYL